MDSYDGRGDYARNDDQLTTRKSLNQDQRRAIAAALTGTAALGGAAWGLSQYAIDVETGEEGLITGTLSSDPPTSSTPVSFISSSPPLAPEIQQEPQISTQQCDDLTFDEAFAEARHDMGPGHYFQWHGNFYNTYYKEEWDHMSPEQHDAFVASLNLPGHDHYQPNTDITPNYNQDVEVSPTHSETVLVDNSAPVEHQTPVSTGDVDLDGSRPELVADDEVTVIPTSHSPEADVAMVKIDNHDAALIDVDHDHRADILLADSGEVLVDTDHDGHFDTYATYDSQTHTLHDVHELNQQVDFVLQSPEPQDQIADNSVDTNYGNDEFGDDFNNHADISDFVA